ncbi:MAG: tetratricopeptide repeat protein [Phycisphaerales bacterium]|nr:tetratricopeptide repeat protein [Phycisphaerales bacterium]
MHTANPNLQRAEMLIAQRRYDLAEDHARRAIGDDPNLATAYSYLAICLSHSQKHTEATEAARRAIGLEPDDAYAHYVLASVLEERDMPREAIAAAEEALRIDPDAPHIWAVLGSSRLALKDWRGAADAAEQGLARDPEHEACTNIRAMALTQLGRRAEAGSTIDATLARNPENAMSHANMGWTLLHGGKPREAMLSFREALRLDPSLEFARAGIVEAMKARWLIYRVFLAYFLFMGRLGSRGQWMVIVGGYVLFQITRQAAGSNPGLAPIATAVTAVYLTFAIGTVVAYPLFNLLLSLSRFGRLALSREQRIAAYALGLTLLVPLTGLFFWLSSDSLIGKIVALLGAPLAIPVALAGLARKGMPRWIMIALCIALAACAGAIVAGPWIGVRTIGLVMPYMLACFLSTWVSNILATMRKPAKR